MTKKLSMFKPLFKMWVEPRKTVRTIVNKDPKYGFKTLSWIYGFPVLLHFAQSFSLGLNWSSLIILIVAAVLAVFAGMIGISISSGLIYWTGKWIGGKGSYKDVRA